MSVALSCGVANRQFISSAVTCERESSFVMLTLAENRHGEVSVALPAKCIEAGERGYRYIGAGDRRRQYLEVLSGMSDDKLKSRSYILCG